MSIKRNLIEQFKRLENIKNIGYGEMERRAFTTLSGGLLNTKSGLRREYMKIDTMFTFDSGENLSFSQSNHMKALIDALSDAIEDEYSYDTDTLKQITVLLDLHLGVEVSYYQSMLELVSSGEIELLLVELGRNDFEELYGLVKKRTSRNI